MEIEINKKQIDEIAYKVSVILAKMLKEKKQEPEFVTVKDAACILNITPDYMRKIADRYPHIRRGEGPRGQLLFLKSGLIEQ